MTFADGSVLTAEQLNAAFAATFPLALIQQDGVALEAIAVNAFVHVDWSSGVTIRNANAANPALWANGFVSAAISSGGVGTARGLGLNPITVASGASQIWLSDSVPGGYQATPPSAAGSIIQPLSLLPAIPGTGIFFTPLSWSGPL